MDGIACGGYSSLLSSSFNLGSDETLLNLLPVDDSPHVLKILWSRILVVKIVSVLPNVDSNHWHKVRVQVGDHILVCSGSKTESILVFVVDEPSPSRALNRGRSCVELGQEVVN